MKVILYARVSRDDLTCENQRIVLEAWASREGISLSDCTYLWEELSSRKTRPVKESVIQAFREGRCDTIVVTRLDRWARSMLELTLDIQSIVNHNGRFVAITQGFDLKKDNFNAVTQLTLAVLSAFAEFEREIIRERTLEGLARAKAQGKVFGRPRIHHPRPKPAPLSENTPPFQEKGTL